MRKITKLFLISTVLSAALIFGSCSNEKDSFVYVGFANALVTVKPVSENECYLQLDENTTLFPVNMQGSPYGDKEVRALINYYDVDSQHANYTKNVYVNWIDSIRTKSTVPSLGAENDEKYGNDPVEIVDDWMTISEDGYLTLRFRTITSGVGRTHYVNLLTQVDPYDPYVVEFRHDANGDVQGYYADGLVAFRLDQLPDTNGETVKLTLKWKAFGSEKSTTFNYCTRKSASSDNEDETDNDMENVDIQALSVINIE